MDTLGWVHFQRGETDLAIRELEKALGKSPDSPIINYHLGMALMKNDRLEEAREKLEKALLAENAFDGVDEARKALAILKAG
jgi:Flp pilus assembly protein TadD